MPADAPAPSPLPPATATDPPRRPPATSTLAFSLVVTMLGILLVIVTTLLVAACRSAADTDLLEFYKSSLSLLVGTFGAWIGAGAAYFFGRENLAESSRSTEEALRIQRDTLRTARRPRVVSDLHLTAMNKDFMFPPDAPRDSVLEGLAENPDYWWIPIVEKDSKGILQDVVHARIVWDTRLQGVGTLAEMISRVDSEPGFEKSRSLHGAAFYVTVALGDELDPLSERMEKTGAPVAIVVDPKGKATHCFSRQDLLSAKG